MTPFSARTCAIRALTRILNQKRSSETAFGQEFSMLSPQDQSWSRLLVMGVCRHFFELDALLNELLERPFKAKDNDVRATLLCGLFQLQHLDTAEHAAVSESLITLEQLDKLWAKGLANAVLRRFIRERETLLAAIASDDACTFNHPRWLIKRIRGAWGREGEAAMLAAQTHPPMTLRVNTQQITREAYLAQLQQLEIAAKPCEHSPDGIQLEQPLGIEALPGFSEGQVSVQDEAAQLAALLLDPQPGERVLDACSAPGGKTCHLLEKQPSINLLAVDLEPKRLERVHENLKRLHLSAKTQAAAIEDLESWWDGTPFDRVLLDVPCSATGVIRRHPDIKLLRRPTDIEPLIELQAKILDKVWQTLKPGGRMLYATCSILPQENALQVQAFAARHSNVKVIPIDIACGKSVELGQQLLPQTEGHDGFYYALLEKMSQETE